MKNKRQAVGVVGANLQKKTATQERCGLSIEIL